MKKLILLTFLIFTGLVTYAQDFGSLGSQWYFDGNNGGPCSGSCSFVKIESVKDSSIQGITVHKLIATHKWYNDINPEYTYPAMYVYQQNDSVYIWSSDRSKFLLTYVFNVSAGDTLVLDVPLFLSSSNVDSTYQMIINSVNSVNLDGQTLNAYKFSSNLIFGDTYIDQIGNTSWFYPRSAIFPEDGYGLRCYSNAQLDTSLVSYPCDTLGYVSAIEEDANNNPIRIYPNPTTGAINIEIMNESIQNSEFKIYDVQGQLRMQELIETSQQIINLSDLESGLYFYELMFNGELKRDKLIIQK